MGVRSQVTRADMVANLRAMGLRDGDCLLVHSALSRIGWVEGGADTVIDAILEVIGAQGHLMAPTFTFSATTHFDVRCSPSRTGIITETLRLRPDAVRSCSPTHSVSVIGPEAEALVAGHIDLPPMGRNSPLDRLAKRGGWVLLLGVDHRSSSTVHIGETYADAPFLSAPRIAGAPAQATVRLPDDTEVVVKHRLMPGCGAAFGAVELPLRRRGAIRDGRIGDAHCQLIKGQEIISVTVELLREDMTALLCTNPACPVCRESRRRVAREVIGD